MLDSKIKSRETKSLLAKLMAAEDINVEYRNNVTTAAFNTENRTLIMPIFKDISDSTTDLFLGHEVGHALYTPEGAITEIVKKGKAYKSLVNIVEDARIEKMIQAKFPGLSRNFYDGYSELMDKNFFGLNGRDVNDLNFIDRINIHFKIGTRAGVEFTDEEQVFVDRISKLRHFDESVTVADDLVKYCGDKQEEAETDVTDSLFESSDSMEGDPDDWIDDSNPSDFPNFDGSDDDDGDGTGEDDGETSDESAEDSKSDAPSDTDSSEDTGEANNSVKSKDDLEDEKSEEDADEEPAKTSGSKGGVWDGNDELVSETMNNFEDRLEDLVDTQTEYTYGLIPDIDLNQIIVTMEEWNALIDEYDKDKDETEQTRLEKAKENFIKFRSENKSLVSYLAKEFEMRKKADEHKRTKVAKTGILNPNKLHSYKFNEDLFLRSEIISSGKNHGFIMYLDWSGSMQFNMADTIDQLMLLALFCKKINVPFEAYAFTDRWCAASHYYDHSKRRFDNVKINDIGINEHFHLLHLASSTLSTSKFQNSMQYLARLKMAFSVRGEYTSIDNPNALQLGGTPLSDCIMSAINMVPEFQKKNKVQIVNTIFLTDGQGHNEFSVWNGTEYMMPIYGSTTVIVDPVTKKHYKVERAWDEPLDTICLKILSERTKARVIGFYIVPTPNKRTFSHAIGHSQVDWSKREEIWDEMKKNNFIVLEDTNGYEQYIWVSSKSLNINTDDVAIDSDMTKGRMKSAFVKQRQGKFGNKVMLSKLAEFMS